MDRSKVLGRLTSALVLLLCLSAVAGCNMVATAMYVINGTNVPAEFNDLKGKKVAVVCRPITALQYRDASVARDLAKQVGVLLKKNLKNVTIIEQREIDQWTDENNWEEYVQLGKAMNADMVVGLDLEQFSLYEGKTLYQGKADLNVLVYEVGKGKDPVFEKPLPGTHYPPNSAIPAVDRTEAQFRRQFVAMLAERIARHFYNHDPTADFASDSTALN